MAIPADGQEHALLALTSSGLDGTLASEARSLAHHLGEALTRIHAEVQREQGDDRLRRLLDNLHEIIFSLDGDLRVTFVNDSVVRLGASPDALVGQPVDALFGRVDHAELHAWLASLLHGDRDAGDAEFRVRVASDEPRWVRVSCRVMMDGDRRAGIHGSLVDITREREATAALHESRRRLTTLMSNLEGMVYRCRNTKDWTMEFVSEGSENLTGYSPDDLVDDHRIAYGSLIHPKDREMVWTRIQAALRHRGPFEIMYRIHTKQGDEKWVWEQGRGVSDAQGRILALEGFISDVTEQQRSAEALERALSGTIRVITQAAEARDPYTFGHQQRVAALAQRIAAELDLPLEEQNGLRVAGLLHDVGKISVPSEILAKPGKLSDTEMRLVWGHVDAGYQILQGIEFPWPIADLVCQHHERMDGSGYPHQLSGDEICLGARILAVSDMVEAMSMHRPYRPALGVDAALAQIIQERGSTLDPDVVDACVRLFRDEGYQLDTPPVDGWPVLADFVPTRGASGR